MESSVFRTKSNRRKLTGAISDRSPLVAAFYLTDDTELVLSSGTRALVVNTALLLPKTTRATQGVAVMALKRGQKVVSALPLEQSSLGNLKRYRTKTLPAAGALLRAEDLPEAQLTLE